MEVRLLGPVELWSGAGPVRVGPPKQRALLAALAYSAGVPVPTGTLIERVWGDNPPVSVRASLQAYVTRLRQALRRAADNPATVNRVGDGYLLDAPEHIVDVHRAREVARQARALEADAQYDRAATLSRAGLDLWRGEPLAGIAGDWADRVRAGFTGERLTLLVVHARAELGRGRPHEVVETLTPAVVEHPDAEHLVAQLMVALHRCGRPTEALDAYHRLRRHLVEQLGVEPGAEVRRLHEAMLAPGAATVERPAGPVDEVVERMHGLIRGYARQESMAEVHRSELRRFLVHCLSAAAQATKLL